MENQKSKDLAYIKHWEKEIAYFEQRYLLRMSEKEYLLADLIVEIIKLFKKELDDARNEYTRDYGQISKAPFTGNKTVFIVQR